MGHSRATEGDILMAKRSGCAGTCFTAFARQERNPRPLHTSGTNQTLQSQADLHRLPLLGKGLSRPGDCAGTGKRQDAVVMGLSNHPTRGLGERA